MDENTRFQATTALHYPPNSSTGKGKRNFSNKTVIEETEPHVTGFQHIFGCISRKHKSIPYSNKITPKSIKNRCDKNTSVNHDNEEIAEYSLQKADNDNNDESYDIINQTQINIAYYEETKDDLAKKLPTDSQLVNVQAEIVELKLEKLARYLSSLGNFARLAYCGVVGHTELQLKTRDVMIRVGDITDDTYCILKIFERTSKTALRTMKVAYGYLNENLEVEAFKIFTQIGEQSKEMCRISDELSQKCKEELTKVKNLRNETLKEKVATEADKEETDKLAKKSRDEKTYQEQVRDESVKNIDEKEEEIKGIVNDEKKLFQEKKELSKKTQNLLHQERQNIKRQNAELKSKYEDDDREILNEVKRYQMKFESALLSNKESYGQELHDIESTYEQKIKSAEDDYKIKIKQNEKELQKTKCENQKLFDEKLKENNDNCDKKVSAAETEYKFTSENINQEYQDAIQASNDELENTLKLATQNLEAALEDNKKLYNSKVKACIDEGAAEINEEWSKRDADEKRIKSEGENIAKSECISAHKAAQETRDVKLSKAFEDKQSKILKAETDTLSTVISDEQTLTEFDRIFEEKLKFDEDAAIKQIKENFQKSKEERERLYEQTCKERTENYDKIISDAENVYKHAETLIEKEYQDAKLTSDDELRNKLTIAKQKFDAALEAINKKYRLKVDNSWFWKNSIREEWSRKQAEVQDQKIDNDESARTENTKAHKIAQQTKQRKLEEAFEVKQDKINNAKTTMNQNLITNIQSYKQALKQLDKAHKEQIKFKENTYKEKIKQKEKDFQEAKKKFYEERKKEKKCKYDKRVSEAENTYQITIERTDREYQDAIQASDVELDNKIKLTTQKLEPASEANKQINSAKVIALKDKASIEVHKVWSENDVEVKRTKNETEHHARPDNTKAHTIDKLSHGESVERTLIQFYKIIEEQLKSDKDAEIKQIKEVLQEAKREKIKSYEQTNKELKEIYDKIVSEEESLYKLAETLIEKEYQDVIQVINEELNNKLTIAQQKLDEALGANNQKYQPKVDNGCFFHNKNEEWSKKDSDEQKHKEESDTLARTQNTEAHKLALKSKQHKLEKTLKDKQEKIEKSKTNMNQNLLSNFESHKQALEDLDKAHKEQIISTEIIYKEKIKDFQEAKKKFYEERQKHSYDKKVSQAENEYLFTIERTDREYQDAIKASDAELDKKIKLATQKFETALESNKQIYSAKIKDLNDKTRTKIHEEWSKKDAKAKKIKCETENRARSDNISAHKIAQDTRDSKFKNAFKSKQESIVKAEIEKNQKYENALKEVKELNNRAVEKERGENTIALVKKNEEIFHLKKEKEIYELRAKKKKEANDECSKNNKIKEDEMNKLIKRDLEQKYKEQSLQIDQNLKDLEKAINDEYQKKLKLIDDHIHNLKERSAKCESDIQHSQEQRMKAIEKFLMLSQQNKDGEDLSKAHAVSIECLHEAKSALNNIQTIFKEASSFWRLICYHCMDMMENGLNRQFELIKTPDTVSRQRVWKGDTFKKAALEYQEQWYALKATCAKTSEEITLVREEINQYICENPTKEEAIKLIWKWEANLLGSDRIKRF